MAVSAQLRKSDVPWPLKGSVVMVFWSIMALCFLVGPWVNTAAADLRPGILNGAVGLLFGVLGGLPSGWFASKSLQRRILHTRPNAWVMLLVPYIDIRNLMMIPCFFIAGGSAGAISWWLCTRSSAGWPWCGSELSVITGTEATFMAAFWYAFSIMINRWYNQLPD